MKRTREAQVMADAKLVDNMVAAEVLDRLSAYRSTVGEKPMAGRYAGYAMILEQLDALWREVKSMAGPHPWSTNPKLLRAHAIGVAARAIQFVTDCCREAKVRTVITYTATERRESNGVLPGQGE